MGASDHQQRPGMISPTIPSARDLVLIGGGHTHALVLRRWGMEALPGVRLTLINPGPMAAYSGMLPGFVAGHYGREEMNIDLVRLARFAGARFLNDAAVAIDPDTQHIVLTDGRTISFDIASIDVGISTSMPELPGFDRFAVPAKPLAAFADAWQTVLERPSNRRLVVIGGGVAGCELAMAMAHATRRSGSRTTILQRDAIGAGLGPSAVKKLRRALEKSGVTVIEGRTPACIESDHILLDTGESLAADFVTGAAGARPHPWLQGSALSDRDGYLTVDSRLRTRNPAIFAVGDCAAMSATPRPKAGVYAVRQAPVLDHNLRASLAGTGGLRKYRPQRDYLKLISLGAKRALVDRQGFSAEGAALWRWKDSIDRRFMRRLSDLPREIPPALPWPRASGTRDALGPKPMCGGCGSKIGPAALRKALDPSGRDALGDDAAVLRLGKECRVMSTDHLRALSEDPATMAKLAAVHALGDIWAMGAVPEAATATIILPRMSEVLAERTLHEIMQAAHQVFDRAGGRIVGGHSTLGAELTIGFTVTGACRSEPITQAGARPGDTLVLTKPIGSGTIMAAEMEYRANGADVVAALALMCQPQGEAAAILANARAMTDVTGFGLIGHAAAVGRASGCGIELWVDQVPLMRGALGLARAGIRSSLYEKNREGYPQLSDASPRTALLFDPQTGGGLLAAVPGDAEAIVVALRRAGFHAAAIGRVTEIPGQIALV
jgi:selenide,water dikinase